jgi:hypothetical protein
MAQNFQNVFVITYGRSGSTLLSGALNTIPGYTIRGENYNFLFPIFRSYLKILEAKRGHGGRHANSKTDPWWGVNEINVEEYISGIRKLTDNVLIGTENPRPRVFGFKEIRYPWVARKGRLSDFLMFIRQIYPEACFIFNYRALDDVLCSGWWREYNRDNSDEAQTLLVEFEKHSQAFAMDQPKFTFEINYEDLCSMSKNLQSMFEFLGEAYNPKDMKRVLRTEYSYGNSTS